MNSIREGGCVCGRSRYKIDLSNAHTLNCHCLDCRRQLGAPFSIFVVVPSSQFEWITKPAGEISLSSRTVHRFCTNCGTYLKWESKTDHSEVEINAMTLDCSDDIQINEEIYVRSRLSWIEPLKGIPQHEASRRETEARETKKQE